MAMFEDDFVDEFLAEFDVLKVRLTYLVTIQMTLTPQMPPNICQFFVLFLNISSSIVFRILTEFFVFVFFFIFFLTILQLEILQRQVSTLADSQSNAEDRTSRTKTEHAVLQARYHMLEDQLREVGSCFFYSLSHCLQCIQNRFLVFMNCFFFIFSH